MNLKTLNVELNGSELTGVVNDPFVIHLVRNFASHQKVNIIKTVVTQISLQITYEEEA